jgi:hypothetical protein
MEKFKIAGIGVLLVVGSIFAKASNITTSYSHSNADTACKKEQQFTKTFNKTFTVNAKHLVVLSNKYGKVDVKTGNVNQVVVNVTITVETSSDKSAQKVFDRINIAFSEGPDFVKAETDIESQSGINIGNWGSNSSDYHIDYDVTMPAGNMLDLSNKYGNSHVGMLTNWVKIEQKYGDFRLDGAGSMGIALAYGGGTIGQVNGLSGTVSYGKLSTQNVKDIQLKTKYSEFKFDKVSTIDLQSAYDDYDINEVNTIKIDSKYGDFSLGNVDNIAISGSYTDYKIKRIDSYGTFKTSYGDVKIEDVKNGFNSLDINGNYTDYTIRIDPSVSYQLDVKTSYGDMSKPILLKTSVEKEKGSTTEIIGCVGNSTSKSIIKARLNYGDLKLR